MTMSSEFLTQTKTCDACGGQGHRDGPLGESDNEECPVCCGSGSVIDNTIPEIIRKYIPAVDRLVIPKIMSEINEHIASKLEDSYGRGVLDGEANEQIKNKEEEQNGLMFQYMELKNKMKDDENNEDDEEDENDEDDL